MSEKTFTTFDIAKILDVYPSTVAKWIDKGELNAFTTPGGHRRVRKSDLVSFLKKHNIPVPDIFLDKKRVLVVDDERGILQLFEKFFKKKFKNIELLKAEDAFSAGIILKEKKPELVFLDIRLPGVGGYVVLERIKKNPDLKNTKIVVITGYDSKEERRRAMRKGADFYLPKPFTVDDIESLTKRFILGGER